eukprot:1206231-Karenia_brevis.AAC.1
MDKTSWNAMAGSVTIAVPSALATTTPPNWRRLSLRSQSLQRLIMICVALPVPCPWPGEF